MLLFLVEWIALVFYWTWFFWPPMFILSLVNAIAHTVRCEVAKQLGQEPPEGSSGIGWAIVSFLVILCGMLWPAFA